MQKAEKCMIPLLAQNMGNQRCNQTLPGSEIWGGSSRPYFRMCGAPIASIGDTDVPHQVSKFSLRANVK